MITITDAAAEKLKEVVSQKEEPVALWLSIRGRGPEDFLYDLRVVKPEDAAEDDVTIEAGDLTVYVDKDSVDNLEGATIDFVEAQNGFKIDNPNPMFTDPLEVKVHQVISEKINPGIASHRGFCFLLGVEGDTAYIELGGGCVGCGLADVTLKQGIEVMIKQEVPEIERVIDRTDHASGENPYYQPAKGAPGHTPSK